MKAVFIGFCTPGRLDSGRAVLETGNGADRAHGGNNAKQRKEACRQCGGTTDCGWVAKMDRQHEKVWALEALGAPRPGRGFDEAVGEALDYMDYHFAPESG